MQQRMGRAARAASCGLVGFQLLVAAGGGQAATGRDQSGRRGQVVERIVAIVDDEIVLLSDVQERVAPLMGQLRAINDPGLRKQRGEEIRRKALEQIVDEKLIAGQATKLKISVTDKDLERAVSDVMRKNNLTREQLDEALRREGKSLEAYKHQILKPQLLRLKVLNATVRSRVSVSEDELRAYYQKNLRDLGVDTKIRARHVFIAIPDGANAAQIAERRKFAASLLAHLKRGKSFADLAKEYSQDNVTREDGGDLGFFGRGTLPVSVEDVVFTLKKGQVRGPLRSARGFHLMKVIDRKESSARPFEEVRSELRQQIYAEKLEKSTRAWLNEVRKRAHVDVKL